MSLTHAGGSVVVVVKGGGGGGGRGAHLISSHVKCYAKQCYNEQSLDLNLPMFLDSNSCTFLQ